MRPPAHRTPPSLLRRTLRIWMSISVLLLVALAAIAIILVETSIARPASASNTSHLEPSLFVQQWEAASGRAVEIRAEDGAVLRAWWFLPRTPVRGAVIVLHGVGDTRLGAAGHAPYLLHAGYAVLLPDLRGHGASDGEHLTYGLLESQDLAACARWTRTQLDAPVHAIGISLGAAVVLQSLPHAHFTSVIAESPFSCFDNIARYRLRQIIPHDEHPWTTVRNMVLAFAYPYARLRTGLELRNACPATALQQDVGRTPVLLIHGELDRNIPISQSTQLASLPGVSVTLWTVKGAGHVQVFQKASEAYRNRVLEWFSAPVPLRQPIP